MKRRKNLIRSKIFNSEVDSLSSLFLQSQAKDSLSFIQRLSLFAQFEIHRWSVNSVSWNQNGRYVLSGSSDRHMCITDIYQEKLIKSIHTEHGSYIFSAKFLPYSGDKLIVSCSMDGMIILTDLESTSSANLFNCHTRTTYDLVTISDDPNIFLSCSEDGTVRLFDLRKKTSCYEAGCSDNILMNFFRPVTAIAVNGLRQHYISVGCFDGNSYIVDRRMVRNNGRFYVNRVDSVVKRFLVPRLEGKNHRVTSLCFSPNGQELLVNYLKDFIYLFNVNEPGVPRSVWQTQDSTEEIKPSFRRFRVRGDWSDTGPNSRPESERSQNSEHNGTSNFMYQFSNLVTRFFNEEDVSMSLLGSLMSAIIGPGSNTRSNQTANSLDLMVNERNDGSSSTRYRAIIDTFRAMNRVITSHIDTIRTMDRVRSIRNDRSDEVNRNAEDNSPTLQSSPSDSSTSTSVNNPEGGESQTRNVNRRFANEIHRSLGVLFRRTKEGNGRWTLIPSPLSLQQYSGHRNVRTIIKKAAFWGDNYIMSGSDCGHIFFWDKLTARLVKVIEADRHVVNCIQPHPFDPLFVSSGIDNDIKVWAPVDDEVECDYERVNDIIQNNEKMLEQTKNTIVVSPSFITRMMEHIFGLQYVPN